MSHSNIQKYIKRFPPLQSFNFPFLSITIQITPSTNTLRNFFTLFETVSNHLSILYQLCVIMSDTWDKIDIAESNNNMGELERIFESITTKELIEFTNGLPPHPLWHQLVGNFDNQNKYPHLLINLFKSPNVNISSINLNYQVEITRMTGLILAAKRNHLEIIKILVSNGANTQLMSISNMTAFFYAAKNGHLELTRYFIDYISTEEFELVRLYNGLTIKQEVEEKIAANPNFSLNYREILKMIEAKELEQEIDKRIALQ